VKSNITYQAQFLQNQSEAVLAAHSIAKKTHVLAYSAGGRTAGRALAQLGQRHKDRKALRLGHVYFAQSDQPLDEFMNQLPLYFDLLEGMTVSVEPGDPVLRVSRMTDRQMRIGAVPEGHDVDLDPGVGERLVEILHSERMVIIDLQDVPELGSRILHSAWYDSPWVATDVMIALLGGMTAAERNLEPVKVTGATVWRFPPDYADRLNADTRQWREQQGTSD
jgi:esterase/lipase superfamily enzyme